MHTTHGLTLFSGGNSGNLGRVLGLLGTCGNAISLALSFPFPLGADVDSKSGATWGEAGISSKSVIGGSSVSSKADRLELPGSRSAEFRGGTLSK